MKIRPPLNGLTPRTMRDAARDQFDWWDPTTKQVYRHNAKRDPLDWLQASPRPDTPAEQVAGVVLAVVIGILGAAALVHWWAA